MGIYGSWKTTGSAEIFRKRDVVARTRVPEIFNLSLFFRAVGMTNVNRFVPPEGIFSDICPMIPDSLESASNEDKINTAGHELRFRGGPSKELFDDFVD